MKQLADFTTHLFVTKGIVTEADAPIYAYGFEVLFSSLFTFGSIFVLAACFDFFVETLVFFAAFFPLRIYAGGYHASTRVRCYFMSLAMIVIFCGLLVVVPTQWYYILNLIIAGVVIIFIYLWAPVLHKNRYVSSTDVHHYRMISLLICFVDVSILLIGQNLFQEIILFFAFGLGMFSAVLTLPIAKRAN